MWKRLFGDLGRAASSNSRGFEPEIHISVVPSSALRYGRRGGTAQLQWIGPDKNLKVGAYQLDGPLVYASKGLPKNDEASCLDVTLPVGTPQRAIGRELDYWPRYTELTPDQRATYLEWLLSKNQRKAPEMGYVFVYFYGLERRAVIDRQDIPLIREEVIRLLGQYSDNRSFFGYASSFLAYISAIEPVHEIKARTLNQVCASREERMHDDILSLGLAWLAHHGQPLPPQLAFEAARQDQRSKNSVVVKRTADEFKKLFAKKYQTKFESGLKLRMSKRERKIDYFPASPTIAYETANGRVPTITIPNVLGISSQFKGLVEIWDECIEELKPLSRRRAKGTEPQSREEYEALPEELRKEVDHPDKAIWDQLFDRYTDDRGRCEVPISALANLVSIEERPKLTLRQSRDLVDTALMMGIYIVPSPHTILRPYKWDEPVALVRANDEPNANTERYYLAAALMLEMGTAMAAADGNIEKVEMLHVSEVINRMFRFRSDDAQRLGAYRSLLIRHPPKLTGLGKRLKEILKPAELEGLGEFLVGVAASNGVIDSGERHALKKAYKALGVDQNKLNKLLDALEGTGDEPPVVQHGGRQEAGEAIPPQAKESPPSVQLNRDVLENIIADTAEVAVLIGQAMGELEESNEDESTETDSTEAAASNAGGSGAIEAQIDFGELEPRYHAFVQKVIQQESWERSEFEKAVQEMGLMVAGTIDAVNLWSDETFDDYLIEEDGDSYVIHLSILEEGE